jgi:TorA maturation chaperone TorD
MEEPVPMKDLAREDVCRILSACYYQPGPELREEQVFERLARAAALVDPALGEKAQRVGQAFAAGTPDDLLLDYTRLFLGPFEIRAKPYGSVWLEGEKVVMGDTTMAVRALYEEGGFELAADFREVPDHVAAELEFLYLLVFNENEARRAVDAVGIESSSDLRRRFLHDHLGRWIGPFTAAVRASAETSFYRELASFTEVVVRMESSEAAPC